MTSIIGVDCACDPQKVGLARATFNGRRVRIEEVRIGGKAATPLDILTGWLSRGDEPTLLALDAPLGWPRPMGAALAHHRAGATLDVAPNELFRRTTDRFIRTIIGRTPLDVGADRIARTAHAALALLNGLRSSLGQSIPLAWEPAFSGISAIEVYPGATVEATFPKKLRRYRSNGPICEELVEALGHEMDLPISHDLLLTSSDALDSVLCVLAGRQFLDGQAMPPTDRETAEIEGWIWCRDRETSEQQTTRQA